MPTRIDPAQLADQLFPHLSQVARGQAPYPDLHDPTARRQVAANILSMLQLQQAYQLTVELRRQTELLEESHALQEELLKEAKRSRGLLRAQLRMLEELATAPDFDPTSEDIEADIGPDPQPLELAPALTDPEILEAPHGAGD